MKFIKGARTWRSILGTQTFFWPLTPPPPWYSINQPLSKGLVLARPQDNDIVLLSYRPRNSMYNAVLRACRVKWGTSSATRHLTGQQQSRTMVFGTLSEQKRCADGASRSPQVCPWVHQGYRTGTWCLSTDGEDTLVRKSGKGVGREVDRGRAPQSLRGGMG